MRTAMPSYAMRVRPSDSVATICKRFRALPKTVSDVSVNTNDLLAGRTSIEVVQIQMVLFETCLTRTLNGSADLILTESKPEVIWRPDYLHVMLAEASLIGGANARITDHLNLLYRRTKIKLEGSCFGLTDLAIKAYSAGELHHFVDRVHALCSISPYKLMFFLQDLKALILRYETAKSGLMLLSIGKHELPIMQLRLQQLRSFHTDILGFFDAVILTQSPDYFSKKLFD